MTKLHVDDLDKETRTKIGLPVDPGLQTVSERLIKFGRILAVLKGLTRNEATWILSQCLYAIQKETAGQDDVVVQEGEAKPTGFMLYTVAKEFGFEVTDLMNQSRVARLVEARQAAMYILWNEGYAQTEIGLVLGGRVASSVSHGYQRITQRLRTDERFRRRMENIKVEIRKGELASGAGALVQEGII